MDAKDHICLALVMFAVKSNVMFAVKSNVMFDHCLQGKHCRQNSKFAYSLHIL